MKKDRITVDKFVGKEIVSIPPGMGRSIVCRSKGAGCLHPDDFPYQVARRFSLEHSTEWCIENISGEWYYLGMYFHFQKPEDAVLFKLFWTKSS